MASPRPVGGLGGCEGYIAILRQSMQSALVIRPIVSRDVAPSPTSIDMCRVPSQALESEARLVHLTVALGLLGRDARVETGTS